jgi:hypothetical protein
MMMIMACAVRATVIDDDEWKHYNIRNVHRIKKKHFVTQVTEHCKPQRKQKSTKEEEWNSPREWNSPTESESAPSLRR